MPSSQPPEVFTWTYPTVMYGYNLLNAPKYLLAIDYTMKVDPIDSSY